MRLIAVTSSERLPRRPMVHMTFVRETSTLLLVRLDDVQCFDDRTHAMVEAKTLVQRQNFPELIFPVLAIFARLEDRRCPVPICLGRSEAHGSAVIHEP